MNNGIKIGDRVYYKDNGPEDSGTIVDILLEDAAFVVKWDRQERSEYKRKVTHIAPGISIDILYNPADENVDQFYGSQLVLIEE